MEKKTLDNSRIIIKLIKSKPSLWDPNHGKYSNRHINEQIWCELSNEVNVAVCDLKAKWNTLRNSYTRSSREDNIQSKPRAKWYLEDDMSFLKNIVQHRNKRQKYQKRLSKTNNEIKKDSVNQIKNNDDDDITIINEPSIDDSSNAYNYNSQSPVHSTTTLSSANDQSEFENNHNNELITNGEDINSTLVKPLKSELNDEIGASNVNQYLQYESHQYQHHQQQQPNSDSLFFQSIEMDFIKLPIKKKRKFKTNVMKLLNELLDETDEENGNYESAY